MARNTPPPIRAHTTPAESLKTTSHASQSFYAQIAIKTSLAIFIGAVLSGFAAYATRMVLTRALSVTEYGLFYGVFSFVSFFLVFPPPSSNMLLIFMRKRKTMNSKQRLFL